MRYQPTASGGEGASADSDVLTLAITDIEEQLVAAVAGELSACDVWFSGPSGWMSASPAVVARLYARQGSARVMVGEVSLADAQRTDDRNGQSSAWILSARGVEASGFELTCQRGGGGVALSGGQFFLRARAVAAPPTLLGAGGMSGLRAVTVSNTVQVQQVGAITVTQSQASNLAATVVQSTAASLQATAAQGAAAGASARWPVYLSDGASALGTTANPFYVGRIRDVSATFSAGTTSISTPLTATAKALAYLWHPSSSTKRVEINRIAVSYIAGATSSTPPFVVLRAQRISTAPGGSLVSSVAHELSDTPNSSLYSATSTPTLASADLFSVAVPVTSSGLYEWRASDRGKPPVLRSTVNEGILVFADVKAALSTAMQMTVAFEWMEI